MAKKYTQEKWFADLIPHFHADHDLSKLSLREAAIMLGAELDVALGELISKRLAGSEGEIIEFIGADEDGRAPAGSFGSRIQLAYLIGLISETDLKLMRKIKALRNHMAHRVRVKHDDQKLKDLFIQIKDAFYEKAETEMTKIPAQVKAENAKLKDADHFLKFLNSIWLLYFMQFLFLHGSDVKPIEPVTTWIDAVKRMGQVKDLLAEKIVPD